MIFQVFYPNTKLTIIIIYFIMWQWHVRRQIKLFEETSSQYSCGSAPKLRHWRRKLPNSLRLYSPTGRKFSGNCSQSKKASTTIQFPFSVGRPAFLQTLRFFNFRPSLSGISPFSRFLVPAKLNPFSFQHFLAL